MPAGLDGNPNPISTVQRDDVIERVADSVLGRRRAGEPLLVAIDGIDGSGKSTFADELAGCLGELDHPVVRSTVDAFHRPREQRWAKGRSSAAGFYLDSHDLAAMRRLLLDPLRAGTGALYRTAAFDEPSDRPVEQAPSTVAGDEIVVVDGIFLCRPELVGYWDHVVFLDAQERVDLERLGLVLDGAPEGGPELIGHVLEWVARIDRYASGMRHYLDVVDPTSNADVVIDNNDLGHPVIVAER